MILIFLIFWVMRQENAVSSHIFLRIFSQFYWVKLLIELNWALNGQFFNTGTFWAAFFAIIRIWFVIRFTWLIRVYLFSLSKFFLSDKSGCILNLNLYWCNSTFFLHFISFRNIIFEICDLSHSLSVVKQIVLIHNQINLRWRDWVNLPLFTLILKFLQVWQLHEVL